MADNIRALHKGTHTSKAAMTSAAEAVRATAQASVAAISAANIDAAAMQSAMAKLQSRSAGGYFGDYKGAEQATMAMGAIIEAMRTAGFMDEASYAAANVKMEKVYAAVGNEDRFVRSSFISAVKALNN